MEIREIGGIGHMETRPGSFPLISIIPSMFLIPHLPIKDLYKR